MEVGSLVGGDACIPVGSRHILYATSLATGKKDDEGARGGRQCRTKDMMHPCEPGQSRWLRQPRTQGTSQVSNRNGPYSAKTVQQC